MSFITIFLTLNIITVLYFGIRTYMLFAGLLPAILQNKFVYGILIILFTQFFLIIRVVFSRLLKTGMFDTGVPEWLNFLSFILMALYAISLVTLMGLDIVLIITRIFDRFVPLYSIIKGNMPTVILVFAGLVLIQFVYGWYNAHASKVTEYTVRTDKLAAGKSLRLVVLSDIHVAGFTSNKQLEYLVERVNGLDPDLVLFAGDVIDGAQKPYIEKDIASVFRQIRSRYGVYGVLGNHEYYGEGIETAIEALEASGIRILRDETLYVDGASVTLVGRDDLGSYRFRGGVPRASLRDLLVNTDKQAPVIVMDHQPQQANEAAGEEVDLQVSGHTHNGQIFPANFIVKRLYDNPWGHSVDGFFNLIVSCGYGTWGPPVRSASYSEIVFIEMTGPEKID